MNFIPRICPECGDPKNKLEDGKVTDCKCYCDWLRDYQCKIEYSVDKEFWVKGMTDWNPLLFANGGNGVFKDFITVQKAAAMATLFRFFHDPVPNPAVKGGLELALSRNIRARKNLFIRGPRHSGKDMMVAMVKMAAAMLGIEANPLPGDWATLKMHAMQAQSYGKTGEDAYNKLLLQFGAPTLLGLVSIYVDDEEKRSSKLKGQEFVDGIFSRREAMEGSIVATSEDFIGQCNALGHKLPYILLSHNTSVILMFSCSEADMLLESLKSKYEKCARGISMLNATAPKTSNTKEKMSEDQSILCLEDVLYFEECFPILPKRKTADEEQKTTSVLARIQKFPEDWNRKAVNAAIEFEREKSEDSLAFQDGKKKAKTDAVRECSSLASKMSEKEICETGRLLGLACLGAEKIAQMSEKAEDLKRKMSEN